MNKRNQRNKSGISLIVLVITIIVIIILAAAVILTINNNNPMSNANKARYLSDRANVQNALSAAVGKIAAEKLCKVSIPPQVDISSGVLYELSGANDGVVGGKIGWDSMATEVPAGYEATTILGMKIPTYSASSKWYIGEGGNVILKMGNKTYTQAGEEDKKVLVIQKTSETVLNQFKSVYPDLEYNPDLTYDQIIAGNYDIVIADGNYGNCNKPELINQLFDHGISVVTIGNDNWNTLNIIKTAIVKYSFSYVANKKEEHYITKNMPNSYNQPSDDLRLITVQEKAIPLYSMIDGGKEYVTMAYMENEQGGKWLHSQMINTSEIIRYFADTLLFL